MMAWKKKGRSLWATPIYEHEFPELYKSILIDGLRLDLEDNAVGYQWYLGEYPITPKAIKEVWELTDGQYRRFMDFLLRTIEWSE
tara:strand:- start:1318 stop:1572 length:255 start_codon:yes stop_codon:yes gene_type:complete